MSFDMKAAAAAARKLPPRQKAVLRGLANGKFRKQIADENKMAYATVAAHTRLVYHRLGIHGRVEAARVAVAAKLV